MPHVFRQLTLNTHTHTHTLLAGTNNAFQVNNLTSLALLYNDVSVLENHHVATLFRIVNDPTVNADIFARLSKEQFREVRAVIIKSVLGTDMRYHFESTNLFKARYHRDLAPLTMCRVRGRSPAARTTERVRTATRRTEPARALDQVPTTAVVPTFYCAGEIARARERTHHPLLSRTHEDVKDDRQLIMKILLHTADISNQAKPWCVAAPLAVLACLRPGRGPGNSGAYSIAADGGAGKWPRDGRSK